MIKQQLQRFFLALLLLLSSLAIGTIGFITIEGYSLTEALYMTVITMSTVGFGEVKSLSQTGQIFTSIFIIFNLAIFAYAISILASYLFEGKLRTAFSRYMIDLEIKKLKNHVIVCGYGRNGSEAVEELILSGRDFVVIEQDPEILKKVRPEISSHMLIADASQDKNLEIAGIHKADAIILATSSDASNVFITLTARELNPEINIIARASQSESESKLYRAGANEVIRPYNLGGMFMAQMVTKPAVIEFLELLTGKAKDNEKYTLESIPYERLKSRYQDKNLRELDIPHKAGGTVVAVKDDIKGLIPNPPPSTLIGPGDTMIILCSESNLDNLLRILTGE